MKITDACRQCLEDGGDCCLEMCNRDCNCHQCREDRASLASAEGNDE